MKNFSKRLLLVITCFIFLVSSIVGCEEEVNANEKTSMNEVVSVEKNNIQSTVKNSKKTLSVEEYESRIGLHDVPISETDKKWGIKTFNPPSDSISDELEKAAYELYDAYLVEKEKLEREQVIQAEADLYAEQKRYWDSIAEALNDILYSGITGTLSNVQNNIANGGYINPSGNYDSSCQHKWEVTFYHRVGTTTRKTESIDGYVTNEENCTICAWLACYECAKCGSIKSYTYGNPGEYSQIGSGPCSIHAGETKGSMIRVKNL